MVFVPMIINVTRNKCKEQIGREGMEEGVTSEGLISHPGKEDVATETTY